MLFVPTRARKHCIIRIRASEKLRAKRARERVESRASSPNKYIGDSNRLTLRYGLSLSLSLSRLTYISRTNEKKQIFILFLKPFAIKIEKLCQTTRAQREQTHTHTYTERRRKHTIFQCTAIDHRHRVERYACNICIMLATERERELMLYFYIKLDYNATN